VKAHDDGGKQRRKTARLVWAGRAAAPQGKVRWCLAKDADAAIKAGIEKYDVEPHHRERVMARPIAQ
jgi:hypothetical protein